MEYGIHGAKPYDEVESDIFSTTLIALPIPIDIESATMEGLAALFGLIHYSFRVLEAASVLTQQQGRER